MPSQATSLRFDYGQYLREENRRLRRDNEFLDGERDRLESLLAACLKVAVGQTGVEPLDLLSVLCDLVGIRPSMSAAEQQGRRQPEDAYTDNLINLVRRSSSALPELLPCDGGAEAEGTSL